MSSNPSTPKRPVQVRFLATIDPTPTDATRYEAGSVWHVPAERADALVLAGDAELIDEPPTPVPADTVAEEE